MSLAVRRQSLFCIFSKFTFAAKEGAGRDPQPPRTTPRYFFRDKKTRLAVQMVDDLFGQYAGLFNAIVERHAAIGVAAEE